MGGYLGLGKSWAGLKHHSNLLSTSKVVDLNRPAMVYVHTLLPQVSRRKDASYSNPQSNSSQSGLRPALPGMAPGPKSCMGVLLE